MPYCEDFGFLHCSQIAVLTKHNPEDLCGNQRGYAERATELLTDGSHERTAMLTQEQLTTYHLEKNHQTKTRSLYRAAVRHWERLGMGEPDSITLADYREKRLKEGVAKDTVRGELTKLIAMATWLGVKVVVAKPRAVERCPEAWTPDQVRTLFKAANNTQRMIWGIPASIFWPSILGVAYDSGERIGAIMQITWNNINFDAGTVYYPAEIRKGGYRDARASLSKSTLKALRSLQLLTPQDAPVFLHGNRTRLWQAYGALLRESGLPSDRRSKFHRLRRTHATFVHIQGGDATAALGHSSDAVTRKSYIDFSQVERKLPTLKQSWLRRLAFWRAG